MKLKIMLFFLYFFLIQTNLSVSFIIIHLFLILKIIILKLQIFLITIFIYNKIKLCIVFNILH